MSPTRRDILKAAALSALLGTSQVSGVIAAESAAPEPTSAPTGRTTTYSFITALDVDRTSSWGSSYVRHIVFTVNQHEDWRDNTTDVLIQNIYRPQDDFTMHIPARPGRDFPGILAEIHDHIEEQASRQRDNGAGNACRMALRGATA